MKPYNYKEFLCDSLKYDIDIKWMKCMLIFAMHRLHNESDIKYLFNSFIGVPVYKERGYIGFNKMKINTNITILTFSVRRPFKRCYIDTNTKKINIKLGMRSLYKIPYVAYNYYDE